MNYNILQSKTVRVDSILTVTILKIDQKLSMHK